MIRRVGPVRLAGILTNPGLADLLFALLCMALGVAVGWWAHP